MWMHGGPPKSGRARGPRILQCRQIPGRLKAIDPVWQGIGVQTHIVSGTILETPQYKLLQASSLQERRWGASWYRALPGCVALSRSDADRPDGRGAECLTVLNVSNAPESASYGSSTL